MEADLAGRQDDEQEQRVSPPPKKKALGRSKFNNRRAEYKGMKFDSQAELRRWKQLEDMQERGEIRALRRQVRFPLAAAALTDDPTLLDPQKVCDYVADFTYYRPDYSGIVDPLGFYTVEDVKGRTAPLTDIFKLKVKMMKVCHGIDVQVVRL
jgi:hypothetical protein